MSALAVDPIRSYLRGLALCTVTLISLSGCASSPTDVMFQTSIAIINATSEAHGQCRARAEAADPDKIERDRAPDNESLPPRFRASWSKVLAQYRECDRIHMEAFPSNRPNMKALLVAMWLAYNNASERWGRGEISGNELMRVTKSVPSGLPNPQDVAEADYEYISVNNAITHRGTTPDASDDDTGSTNAAMGAMIGMMNQPIFTPRSPGSSYVAPSSSPSFNTPSYKAGSAVTQGSRNDCGALVDGHRCEAVRAPSRY